MKSRSVFALCAAALGYALAQTMVAPILPVIGEHFDSSVATTSWVISAYLLATAIVIPFAARLADRYGRRLLLLCTLGLFIAGSLFCAFAGSIELLILGRVLQGLGGATLPLTLALTRDCVSIEKAPRAIGAISATVGAGSVIGILVGSLLVDSFGLKGVFLVNVPLALIGIAAILRWVPDHRPTKVVTVPLIDFNLVRNRTIFLSNTIGFALGAAKFGTFILIPEFVLLLDLGDGVLTANHGSLFLLPFAIAVILSAPTATRATARFGTRKVLTTAVLIAGVGFYLLASGGVTPWLVLLATGLLGAGIGAAITVAASLVVTVVERNRASTAAGMHTISRMLGGFVGGQLAAVLMAAHISAGTGLPDLVAFADAFSLLAGLLVIAAIAAIAVPRRRSRLAEG